MVFYKEILRLAPYESEINPDILRLCHSQVAELTMRLGTDKLPEVYDGVDDKWLFTEPYLRSLGTELRARDVLIKPLNGSLFLEDQVKTHLRLGVGLGPSDAPRWFWDVLQDIQSSFSDSYRSSLVMEGTIVFLK
jgi:hypothetical protein